jgi:erythromycin esterase-like protein
LVDRLSTRGQAELEGASEFPVRYYQLRDEWMARAVSALADSIKGSRKVVVWLHNDHARYGKFPVASDSVRSTGGYLRQWYGSQVFSVGFFMGHGVVMDNGRNLRSVATPDPAGVESFLGAGSAASYLILRGNSDVKVREWAGAPRPYLRMGVDPLTLVPANEFDALIYVDSVQPPSYDVR